MELVKTIAQQIQVAQEPAQKELTHSKNGSYILARQSEKIGIATENEIKNSLRKAMLLVGIRAINMPEEEEKAVLIDYIRRNFANISVREIDLAFENAVIGVLEVDSNCYENFSCRYFSDVMIAYFKWAKSKSIENEKIFVQEKNILPVYTDWSDTLERLQLSCNEGNLENEILPVPMYEWLLKNKGLEVSREEKLAYIEKAVLELKQEAMKKRIKGEATKEDNLLIDTIAPPYTKSSPYWSKIEAKAKRIIIREYIQTTAF